MNGDLYTIIGIVIGVIYLCICIANIFLDFTHLGGFVYFSLSDYETVSDEGFTIALMSIMISMLLIFTWPLVIFATIIWLLTLLKKKKY